MPGSFGDAQYGVGRDPGVAKCPTFMFFDWNSTTTFTQTSDLTYCGFNNVDEAYCPYHKGDSIFRNYAQEAQ